MQHYKNRGLIVGAGPVGVVCALVLNRQGIDMTVFKRESEPVRDQRPIAKDLRVNSASLENIINIDEALGAKQMGKFDVKRYYDASFQSQ